MGSRNSLNLGERCGRRVLVETKQQEIGNGEIVQLVRDAWILADTLESITENYAGAESGIIEGLDAHMVTGAEESLPCFIPNSEREIPKQMLDAIQSPCSIRVQNQFGIGPAGWHDIDLSGGLECGEKLSARIDPRIRDDPGFAVQGQRL